MTIRRGDRTPSELFIACMDAWDVDLHRWLKAL